MKKIISLMLVVFNLLSVSVFANGAITEEQKNDLSNLGIITGDPGGDLRLNDAITRAEATKMICVAGNIGTQLTETNAFPDVPESHWAYKYIAAAKAKGIVHGDENGNFHPENSVTNEEFVKMAVCLIGYQPMADTKGGFPAGYTAAAAQTGLTENMQFSINVPATRNDAGVIIHNALDIPLMKEKTYDKNPEAYEYVIMNGQKGLDLITLRNGFQKFDSSRDNISKLSKEFASQYLYKEGDLEKSFELYPDITYTSGTEKTADGKVYECPAKYDDLMVAELVNDIKKDEAKLIIDETGKIYNVEYAIFKEKILVPLDVFDLIDCDVQFDETRYVATVSKNSTVLEMIPNIIGMRKNQAEGFWIPLEVCARFVDNTLYVPMEAIANEFHIITEFDSASNCITLKTEMK